jgi:hypothetical protein
MGGGLTTTFNVTYDTGMGNDMYLRGDWDGWANGILMTWTAGNVWTYSTTSLSGSFECKPLINDITWSTDANTSGNAGDTVNITPNF